MTIPGKGGRPRKWRTDADRVRAFRARQRGEDEPTTLEAALVDGDELAHALERITELQADLIAAASDAGALIDQVEAERRRTERSLRRAGRLESELITLREAHRESSHELAELRADNDALRRQLQSGDQQPGAANRAQRRLAAKRERKGPTT